MDLRRARAHGVDRQIIDDEISFVAECRGAIVGAGGWSFRSVLLGGDATGKRNAACADPEREAAQIRAHYVDPGRAWFCPS